MAEKVRALLWEECRVGGAITGVTLAAGLGCLLVFRYLMGGWGNQWAPHHDPDFFTLIMLGPPALAAFLLIFNPDYSGVLTGGYSRRILRLPVPTFVVVVVTVCTRTFLVVAISYLMTASAAGMYDLTLGSEIVLYIALLYLGVQLFDWLRIPVSGLSSLALLLVLGAIVLGLAFDTNSNNDIGGFLENPRLSAGPAFLLIGLAVVAACALAVPVVHAARIGRSVGVPEIWTWHRGIAIRGPRRRRPFASPIAAQIWFDLRSTGWILPFVTVLLFGLAALLLWALPSVSTREMRSILAFIPFLGVTLGAGVQGARSGVAGFRRTAGMPGYSYLRPLTSTQYAQARMISNAISLVPTVLLACAIHVYLAAGPLIVEIFPSALADDLTSMREIVWILISRGVLVGLLGWVLLAVTTRIVLGIIAASTVGFIVLALLFDWIEAINNAYVAQFPVALFVIAATAVFFYRAWNSNLLSVRALLSWAGGWAFATWILYGVSRNSFGALAPNLLWHLIGFLVCLAIAALVPLPFIAVLNDVRRRRHSSSPDQQIAQHATRTPSAPAIGMSAVLVALLLWLGWPARPVYEQAWRDRGFPPTLAALNVWYQPVPDAENAALKYIEIADDRALLAAAFTESLRKKTRSSDPNRMHANWYDDVLVVGGGENELGVPVSEEVRTATEEYWEAVTSQTAPRLKEIAAEGLQRSRYPVDLTQGIQVELEQLARLRQLGRELVVDAWHWSFNNQPEKVSDSLFALFPLAASMEQEPILISQLVRMAILGIAEDALESLLNRTSFSEAELARLQAGFANAVPPGSNLAFMDRSMVGESLFSLDAVGMASVGIGSDEQETMIMATPYRQLIYPATTDRLIMTYHFVRMQQASRLPWAEFAQWSKDEDLYEATYSFAPLSAILLPALSRAYEAAWRVEVQFDLAVVALAVERYRLSRGDLPDTLDQLVPEFIEAVPVDLFSPDESPLRFRPTGNGNYVVYSVSINMTDNGGDNTEKKDWHRDGDLIFSMVGRPAV